MCLPNCSEAPRALTSDPVNYPIEPGILPLVFGMKRLGIFEPCWSCEGHLGPSGVLWKLPRVWFYSESSIHVRMLVDGLKELETAGKLDHRWRITVTFSDPDNPETTFSLEPVVSSDHASVLSNLQQDVIVIARSLHGLITKQGRRLQRDTSRMRDNGRSGPGKSDRLTFPHI
jgi:hypothetical protein